jgi:hypothetical protein
MLHALCYNELLRILNNNLVISDCRYSKSPESAHKHAIYVNAPDVMIYKIRSPECSSYNNVYASNVQSKDLINIFLCTVRILHGYENDDFSL